MPGSGARLRAARLPDGRLHLSDGPIDLVVMAEGPPGAREHAFAAAAAGLDGLLDALVAELPLLRLPADDPRGAPRGSVACAMRAAAARHRGAFLTPMAAVAGAVADAVLAAMTAAAPLDRAYVNNGGDIALHLAPGTALAIGVVPSLARAAIEGRISLREGDGIGGVATSGFGGRSFTLGIADAATILARDAASADAAATVVANAVTIDHPGIRRAPARALDPDSDLGDRAVTVAVGPLPAAAVAEALDRGAGCARRLIAEGMIAAALIALRGAVRVEGGDGWARRLAAPAVPLRRLAR